MLAAAGVGADERSIRRSGVQDTAPMWAIGTQRAWHEEGEFRRRGTAQQQSLLGTEKPEAESDMQRSSNAILMAAREWVAGA